MSASLRQPWPVSIALRYLRPRGQRSFISFISLVSMIGIALAVAVLIATMSVMNGFETELERRILGFTPDASVIGFEQPLDDWESVRAEALETAGIRAAAPFVEGQGMVAGREGLIGVNVRGIDPALESTVSNLDGVLVAGSLVDLSARRWNAVVGRALADELEVGIGDDIILVLPEARVTIAGLAPTTRSLSIVGIFEAGMREFDRGLILTGLGDAAALFRTGGRASGVGFDVDDIYSAGSIAGVFAQSLVDRTGGKVYVSDWTQQHANVFRSIQLTKPILFIMLSLVIAVAAFNIVSTLFMVVREKRGDVAILRSFGAAPRAVLGLFSVQGTAIGIIGTLAGLGLGLLLVGWLGSIVGVIERWFDVDLLSADAYLIGDLVTEARPGEIAQICLLSIGLAVLATIYPALMASRLPPAEALRHE